MMKKLFAVILIVFIAIPAFSQIKFGIKAGVSTTNLSMPSVKTVETASTSYSVEALSSAKYGFHGGAFMRVTLLGVYVQPELLFTNRTSEYTVTELSKSICCSKTKV